MKKWKFLLSVVLLCAIFGGCTVQPPIYAQSEAIPAQISDPAEDEAKALACFSAYGMTFDAKSRILTYNGQRVRYFEDLYPIHGNTPEDGMAGMTFFDENGVVDVYATRDLSIRRENGDGSYDPSGRLTGLAPFSQEEFNARDLKPLTTPAASAATAGEPMTAAELKALYAPYAAYGLTYDAEKDLLYYDGQQVRRFTDVLSTNGEDPKSGKFKGSITNRWDDGGTVDIRAVRDYSKPNADGHGRLTGVKAATQEEFYAATAQMNETGPLVRLYRESTTANCAQEG